jgi:CHAD domain-containing protein
VIRPDAETALELAFERGWLRAGENAEPVREIAIHLKRGSTETMYRVALELHALTPLVVSLESNVGRGYRLITGAAPAPQKATRLELAADIDLQSGLQEIFGNALRHLLANQAATLAGDVEGLHQMRVALRRIRAGLALFAPALEPYAARRFTLECRRLGRVFGQARDLDVFALETLDAAEQAGLKVERLRPLARTRREGADGQVEATIADPAFTGFFLALSAWISGSAWAAPGADAPAMRHRPLARVAPDLLDRLARKCATLGGGHLAGQSPEALHDLRKRLKILRYCVEFTGSLYDGIAVKRYRQACGHLQEQLGAINDMQATIELVAGLARSNGIDLVPEAGALAQWCENQAGACRLGLRAAWRGFEKADPFWR